MLRMDSGLIPEEQIRLQSTELGMGARFGSEAE